MQNAMRRALGVGGATAVALAATLALAGVADAHTPKFSTGCLDNGQAFLNVDLSNYTLPRQGDPNNTFGITYTPDGGKTQTVQATRTFATGYPGSISNEDPFPVDGTTAGEFTITIFAWDDANGDHSVAKVGQANAWDGTFIEKTKACPQHGGGTPTPPPPTKTTTPSQPPTSAPGTSSAPTSTSAAVAPVSTKTPPGGGLAYTGVSTELPLIIGGVLIVLGGGALITMRIMKRRRAEG
ncbi:MAG TPA: hypothetical protein VJ914_37025 [Pseudonocardiaceae bacterium]|nr:hypothetical protein [Pseudonocardiaceae bacterium]